MSNKKNNLDKIITDFIEYCEIERSLSPTTALKYHYRLTQFLVWAKAFLNKPKLTLKDLNLNLIRKFHVALNRRQLKDSTQYNFMVTLRSFLKYLIKHDYRVLEPEKIELGKYDPARSLKFLKPEQLDKLLAKPNVSKLIGLRDRAILEIFFSTGLRVSELASLNREQVDLKSKEFSVVGKGNRRRVVFLSDTAADWLKKYLKKRQDNYKPFFVSYFGPHKEVESVRPSKGSKTNEKESTSIEHAKSLKHPMLKKKHLPRRQVGRMLNKRNQINLDDPDGERFRLSVRSIQRLVKKYTRQAGINVDVTPHTIRHSFATDLLMAGADMRTVQESLGHKNISTTQIYTHITNLQLKKAHQKFHRKWKKE